MDGFGQHAAYNLFAQFPGGLWPHFATVAGAPITGYPPYFSQYYDEYDSLQVPLRIGMDFVWFNDARARGRLRSVAAWAKSRFPSLAALSDIRGEYNLDGTDRNGTQQAPERAAAIGVAAMADPNGQALLNNVYKLLLNTPTGGAAAYYREMIVINSLLMMTGNFPRY